MSPRPYTVLSCCISMDGYLDDASPHPLQLSNPADFARVDALRASCDAILVGAATVRNDDPRLLVRSDALRAERERRGMSPSPLKVTVTTGGELDARSRFFTTGTGARLVYAASAAVGPLRARVRETAAVVDAGPRPGMRWVSEDLAARGVERLMVEGGGDVLTQFLEQGLADELQLAIAPVFVGDAGGRRFVRDGRFPWAGDRRAALVATTSIGDVALLRYALSDRALAALSAPDAALVTIDAAARSTPTTTDLTDAAASAVPISRIPAPNRAAIPANA